MQDVNWIALSIFVVLFGLITWLGFAAAHWRKGDLDLLHEWGLGGRRFGTLITWFLVGGDVYTAYTFIAVPALAFGAGAVAFFAVPYTIIIYPLVFLAFRRLWYVCSKHGYITAGDFVRGRFGNRWLALAVTRDRHRGDHAVHRLAAGRHPSRDRRARYFRDGTRRGSAAAHCLYRVGGLHLFERIARAGIDRHRQGYIDLYHGTGRHHRHPDRARRLPQDLRRHSAAKTDIGGAGTEYNRLLQRVRDAGLRIRACVVSLSALP